MRRESLQRIFDREVVRFAEQYPGVMGAELRVRPRRFSPGSRETFRDIAWCYPTSMRVYMVRRSLTLHRENLVAIVRHELAHLCEPSWTEVEADALAARIGRQPIRYDARGVQTVGKGGPRPRGIHQ